ncbi:MAG: outer membrane protein transport protein [Deltaproteobacteria bacterium]|nr:outer membrane protein transport protein [Deltaproteobacteria bacterium]
MKILFFILSFFSFSIAPIQLWANTGETYGLGSRVTSMGGAIGVSEPDAFGAFYNPASLTGSRETTISLGIFSADTHFEKISSVVVENDEVGHTKVVGDVSTDYAPTRGTLFGFSAPLRKEFRRVSVGLSGFVPFERLLRMNTSEPFVPSYPLYENRTQRFSLYGGLGVEIFRDFSLGAGGAFFMNTAGKAYVRTNQSGTPTLSMAMDVVPALAPIVGGHYRRGLFAAGVTWRGVVDYHLDFVNEAETPAIAGGSTPLSLGFDSSSTFFYDPQQVSFGASYWLFDQRILVASELSWQDWSRYESPLARFKSRGDIDFGNYEPASQFRDIWVPRFGMEYLLSPAWSLRGGYFFQPTPIAGNPGSENLLDSDKHVISGGLGIHLPTFAGLIDAPLKIDLHCQYHRLSSRHIDKTDPDEVGAPGFNVGGSIWNYGVTLSSAF